MMAKTQDQLLETFRNTVPYRPECDNCGEKFFRKRFEENLKELLEEQGSDVISSESELAFWECPNCGDAQDFSLKGGRF